MSEHWTNTTSSVSSSFTVEELEKYLAEWKAMMGADWARRTVIEPRIPPPEIEPPKEPWPIFFSNLAMFYQPVSQALLLLSVETGPPVDLTCLVCKERLAPGQMSYFCGEECERAFRDRCPDAEFYDPMMEKAARLLENEPDAD